MDLQTPLNQATKVGTFYTRRLEKLNIFTLGDLVYHFPFRYENISLKKIHELEIGDKVSITGSLLQIKNTRTRFRKFLTLATINDGSASVQAVWFNQPYLTKSMKVGLKISLAGKVDFFSNKLTFISPEHEIITPSGKKLIHTQGLVAVYPETAGVRSKWIRSRIKEILPNLLPKIEEILPAQSLRRNALISRKKAIWQIHFPTDKKQIIAARKRLAFEELFITSLLALERKAAWQKNFAGYSLKVDQEKILSLINHLPFHLTAAQSKVLKEILADIAKDKPMNRLLQGDVGSGKTVVAAIAAYCCLLNGFKTVLMAPTEILAFQHFSTIQGILSPLGLKIGLRTSSRKDKGEFDILIGTHALISKVVELKNLALVIIDEQHRFGVEQRALLREKGKSAHVLTMTATPIPRSLALTFYGDLDISILDELPVGRKPIKTYLVPLGKRTRAYQFIRDQISQGKQAFIICPLIDPSETLASAKAASEEHKRLQSDVFPDLKLALLHGRMKSKEKEATLGEFLAGKFQIMVATPLVEVGIDIPNATVMMIEAAERFGLASLHQLRGRVGRAADQSFCLLFTESTNPLVIERLHALEKTQLGLELAEKDLKIRGPGQLYGTAQSGLPSFKIALLGDLSLIESAKKEAALIHSKSLVNKIPNLKLEMERLSLVPPD